MTILTPNLTEFGIAALVFFAYSVRVLTGFGSVIMLSPLLSLLYPPKEAVILVVLLESFVNLLFFIGEKLNFSLKEVYFGASIGVLTGLFLFNFLPSRTVGIVIGVSLTIISLLLLFEFRFRVERERELFTFSGFLSGFLGVLTGVTGPQVVVTLVNQGYDSKFVRNFMISYLFVVYTAILFVFLMSGHLRVDAVLKLAKFSPAVVLAYVFGKRVVAKFESEKLEKVILLLVLLSSFNLLVKYTFS